MLVLTSNGFVLQSNKRGFEAHDSVRTPQCVLKRSVTFPRGFTPSTYNSFEDADLRGRFPELVESIGGPKLHNACNVTDDDRRKYCKLEG